MFDTLNYELERSLSKIKSEMVIGLMKDEFVGKTVNRFVQLVAETYSYLTDASDKSRKSKK